MELQDVAPQVFPVQMGVDLGGGDAGMAEHLLHGPQVGADYGSNAIAAAICLSISDETLDSRPIRRG